MRFATSAPRRIRGQGSALAIFLSLGLAACGGGGGGGGGDGNSGPPTGVTPTPELLQPSATFAQRCAPANPYAAAGLKTGSLAVEKQWLRSYFDEAYLWPDEVPSVNADAAEYSGSDVSVALDRYFDALRSPKLTDSGARRDKFSFSYPSAEWQQLSGSGIEAGYGIEWAMASPTPPRRIRVAYVEAGSAAAAAGVQRGDELLSLDGYSADANDAAGVDALNQGMYPGRLGASHQFVFTRAGASLPAKPLLSANITKSPVLLRQVLTAADGARVGHLVFNDHVAPAEVQLIAAINDFKTQGISDLVLDLRYNGGGYLYIASELAYMIAGPGRTGRQVFERLSYNRKRSAEASDTPFYNTSCLLSGTRCTSEQPLPTLNLGRVYVLTQKGTCSASEAIINGLRGVDVEVVQIGGQTCGKPYGFVAKDNCGVSYFPIEFVGTNAKGFGDYSDGFMPVGAGGVGAGRKLPGCEIDDDFTRALGDPSERMLAAALSYRAGGQCPARSVGLSRALAAAPAEGQTALEPRRSPARSNRIGGVR